METLTSPSTANGNPTGKLGTSVDEPSAQPPTSASRRQRIVRSYEALTSMLYSIEGSLPRTDTKHSLGMA